MFIAGQVGWDAQQKFHSEELAPQFEQALQNVLAVLAEAGGRPGAHLPHHRASAATSPPTSRRAPQLGRIWKRADGQALPGMSMIFVSDLLDRPGKIELEATAVVPA